MSIVLALLLAASPPSPSLTETPRAVSRPAQTAVDKTVESTVKGVLVGTIVGGVGAGAATLGLAAAVLSTAAIGGPSSELGAGEHAGLIALSTPVFAAMGAATGAVVGGVIGFPVDDE